MQGHGQAGCDQIVRWWAYQSSMWRRIGAALGVWASAMWDPNWWLLDGVYASGKVFCFLGAALSG